jgi:predicted hotdog family 3-hydroxylacyl-ACP dehydratase
MLEKHQIEGLLPHQGTMFLLERVIGYDRDKITCVTRTHQSPTNPLRHENQLPAHVAIEYAAQAAGIHGGLLNSDLFPDAPAQMGYLAVISNAEWKVERLDDLREELTIHAVRTAVTPGGRAYRVRIEHEGDTIMTGDLVIALETAGREVV